MTDSTESTRGDEPRQFGSRSKARKRALDILFEADLRGTEPTEALADHIARSEPPVRPFTSELVRGVAAHREELDGMIEANSGVRWTIDRMPCVDRNLARIAIYEIEYGDVAGEIAIDEAVSLARDLSTDESPDYLNGMLAKVLQAHQSRQSVADSVIKES